VKTYTIGEIAEEFGLTLRTLRFYETRGLLTPERRGLARMYTDADRKRIREVVAMKKLGFSVREIGSGEFSPEKFAEQLALVRQQRAELDKVIGCQTARKVAPRSASNVDPLSMLHGEEAARRSWSGLRSRAGSGSVVCGELRACS
jgi:DNA-binding transcriptional MerR regulator